MILPVNSSVSQPIWTYYMSVNSFERIENDTKVIKSAPNKTVFERMMPIISEEDRVKVKEIKKAITDFC
jgi:hypothetical protein